MKKLIDNIRPLNDGGFKMKFAFVRARLVFTFLFLFASQAIHSQDYYTVTTDLNMRSGAGTKHSTIIILVKGDTLKLLESSEGHWAKIQYQDKVGYAAKQYIQKMQPEKLKIETVAKTEVEPESDKGFSNFLIFALLIIIVTAILLNKNGGVERNKSTAIVLSFFFGGLGFQKFYLGESGKGIISIIFSWTFIPAFVGIIDSVKWARMNEAKFYYLYNQGKMLKTTPSKQVNNLVHVRKTTTNRVDNTIIDVNSEKLNLTVERDFENEDPHVEPPYWSHTYVFSYNEIKHATKAQKEYYLYFKSKVINGEYVDIKDNANYAFILYFDFLKEFEQHRDLELLDQQFRLLGRICPKTRSYSLRSLQDELSKRKDPNSREKSRNLELPGYQFEYGYSNYDPDLYKLGSKYKEKLGLTKEEVTWLNKFYNSSNVFTSIEECLTATISHYVTILKELDKQLKNNETTLAKEAKYFKDKLTAMDSERNSHWGSYATEYKASRAESEVYHTLFKRVENSVRDSFGHKRKLSGEFPYSDGTITEEFEKNIGNAFDELIVELKDNIGTPSVETQIVLNTQNVNRWKIEFEAAKTNFKKEELDKFLDAITSLEETNQKNPNIENIFFEASKFIAKYNRVQALKYYASYIYYDLKSNKFNNKELTKTVQKSLFKTDDQINDFKIIIADLIKTGEIKTALDKISEIYTPKRKKIQLDLSEIEKVAQKHEGTVELLNEYLLDEKEETEFESGYSIGDEIEVTIVTSSERNSIFISGISMEKVQEELIKMIINNSYEIPQDVVEKYAIQNGMFKNQLIDSINDACEEHLDGEALIEEDDVNYIIEESYYQEILK